MSKESAFMMEQSTSTLSQESGTVKCHVTECALWDVWILLDCVHILYEINSS